MQSILKKCFVTSLQSFKNKNGEDLNSVCAVFVFYLLDFLFIFLVLCCLPACAPKKEKRIISALRARESQKERPEDSSEGIKKDMNI